MKNGTPNATIPTVAHPPIGGQVFHGVRHHLATGGLAGILMLGLLAQAMAAPVVSGQNIRDFTRVTFEWPESTRIQSRMQGNQLIVTFDRRASEPDFSRLLTKLPRVVQKAALAEDGRTVTLTLDRPYRIRSFISGRLNGVDLMETASAEGSGASGQEATARPATTTAPSRNGIGRTPIAEALNNEATAETTRPEANPPPSEITPQTEPSGLAAIPTPNTGLTAPVTSVAAMGLAQPASSRPTTETPQQEKPGQGKPGQTKSATNPTDAKIPVLPPLRLLPKPKPASAIPSDQNTPRQAKAEAGGVVEEPAVDTVAVAQVSPPPSSTPAPPTPTSTQSTSVIPSPLEKEAVRWLGILPLARPPEIAIEGKPALVNAQQGAAAASPEAAPIASPDQAETPESSARSPEPAADRPAATEEKKPDTAPETAAANKEPLPKIKFQPAPAEAARLEMQLTRQGNDLVLNFPWTQRAAAAAFYRGGQLWVVFDHLAALQLTQADAGRGLIGEMQGGAMEGHTVLRLRAPSLHGARMRQTSGSLAWQLVLTLQGQWPENVPSIQARSDKPDQPYLLIGALETAPAVTLSDPDVGDSLLVVPSYSVGQGIAPGRRMVEMELPATVQGIVILPQVPGIITSVQRNGLRVGTAEGLRLSADLPGTAASREDGSSVVEVPSFFAVAGWPGGDAAKPESIAALQGRLLPAIGQNAEKNPDLANEARLQLVQGYLAQGLASEALGEIEQIRASDLGYYIHQKVSALSGLANFLLYRMPEAARDFAAPELQSSEEAEYWRIALAELNGRSDELFDYIRFNNRYIRQYPGEVRQRLGLIAADRLVARSRYNEAVKLLDGLRQAKLVDEKTTPAVDFLMGETLARTGYPDKAVALWQPLSENMDALYWRARAEYALINLQLATGKITEEEALPRLDRLRILWRNDPLELQVLGQIAALELKYKHWRDALRTLREITQSYPNTQAAFDAAQKMAETFIFLFNEDGAKDMKPLDALALYYEFKDLTPVEEAGDRMIRNLADRLAEVDLLDRAAALLEHQVRYRLEGEERSRVGARLALIDLLNRQPQKALDVLELTGYGANTEALQNTRALLTARALADLKEGDRAIALLEDDPGEDAQLLKLDVLWDAGKWPELAAVGEAILGARKDPTAQLTESEMGALLKLAVSYAFQKDTDQLRYLRDYFTPLVQTSPQKDLFAFLTNDTAITPENMAQLSQNIGQMQSFLSKWREQIKQAGLSETVK